MRYTLWLISSLLSLVTIAQSPDLQKVRLYREKNESAFYNDFISFLKIPNVATDTVNIRKNADFLLQLMKSKGLEDVRLLEADDKNLPAGRQGVPPVAYGEVKVPGATKTIIFYAHYDGQPVNPSLWAKGLNPFQPQLLNGRLMKMLRFDLLQIFPWMMIGGSMREELRMIRGE